MYYSNVKHPLQQNNIPAEKGGLKWVQINLNASMMNILYDTLITSMQKIKKVNNVLLTTRFVTEKQGDIFR